MASNTCNTTSNSIYESTRSAILASDCTTLLVMLISECLAIVILNLITIIVFTKRRHLHRRSKFLVINLAIVDFLVGLVSVPALAMIRVWYFCYARDYNDAQTREYKILVLVILRDLFPLISLVNLAAISLERLHATFFPFKHRFTKKWVYGVIISSTWLVAPFCETSLSVLHFYLIRDASISLMVSLIWYVFFLSIICFSYISLFIKVRYGHNPQHHGATNRDRKLTATLIWVSFCLASVLVAIFCCNNPEVFQQRYLKYAFQSVIFLFYLSNVYVSRGKFLSKSTRVRRKDAGIQGRSSKDISQNLKL